MDYLDLTKQDIQMQESLLILYKGCLNLLPPGRLGVKKNKNYTYYVLVDPETKERKYIKRKDMDLVYQLKYKRLLEEAVARLEENLVWQNKLIKHYKCFEPNAVYESLPKTYHDFRLPFEDHEYLQSPESWSKAKYKKNSYPIEKPSFTSFGLVVRSKSEALIAELLHAVGIPFRYEEEVILYDKNGKTQIVYPDFSFLTPAREKIYWEHLGMWTKEAYAEKNRNRLQLYYENGIVVSNNLIITMDNPGGGVDASSINRIITGILMPLFQ